MTFETVALALVAIVLCISIRNPNDFKELATHHELAIASVTGTTCWDHSRVDYTFQVAANSFSNSTHWLNIPCDQVKTGDSISVFYDPAKPEVNTTMSPVAAYDHFLTDFFVRGLAVLALLGLLLHKSFGKGR